MPDSLPSEPAPAWRGALRRGAAFGLGRVYAHRGGRARELLDGFGHALEGRILDVGAGANAAIFRAALGARYEALDIAASYKFETTRERDAVHHVCDLEGKPLPFADRSYGTVICLDVLEHVDDIHLLYDQLFRVADRRVVVSLPNNWPGFLWNVLAGRNLRHRAGYGLAAEPKRSGERHKHFFNLEEAAEFLAGRCPPDFTVELAFRFEHGLDGVLAQAPGLTHAFRVLGKATLADGRERFGALGPFAWAGAKLGYAALRALDLPPTAALYGWGDPVRFHNFGCRQVWAVFARRGG
jgi:hypothetical protein